MLITNALVPFGEGFQTATMQIEAGRITALEPGSTALAPALDWQGDYLLPGLVEIHTDNLENHFVPRPKVIWPNGLAACLAHDAQMAAAGVTTVFDAITMGSYDGEKTPRQLILDDMLAAIDQARRAGVLRIDHRLHFRCELSAKELLPALEPHRDAAGLGLVSIMDHTPGQRQWRDLEKLYDFAERNGKPRAEIVADVERRIACGRANAEANRGPVLALFADRGLPLASHDDTTPAHIDEALADGISISEFPCSMEAARLAKERGLWTVGGAPNIVRDGSHSGNVSMNALSDLGQLDALSSDYVPSALLQAVWSLAERDARRTGSDKQACLVRHLAKVTRHPAAMVGLEDRGWLAVGARADFLRVQDCANTPVVRQVFVAGQRVS